MQVVTRRAAASAHFGHRLCGAPCARRQDHRDAAILQATDRRKTNTQTDEPNIAKRTHWTLCGPASVGYVRL